MTTIETLFGPETVTPKPRSLRFKVIRPVYESLTIKESLPDYLTYNTRVTSSSDIYRLFKFLVHETKEHFITLHLDSKNKILCVDLVSSGSLTASIVHPREVMKSALLSSAAAMIMVHNHPSGQPEPSREDLELTSRLKEAGDLLGIRVLDHVIIGEESHVSFADRGLL